jgi:hypothetical protein
VVYADEALQRSLNAYGQDAEAGRPAEFRTSWASGICITSDTAGTSRVEHDPRGCGVRLDELTNAFAAFPREVSGDL